jgi:hypothetical protein
VPEEKITVVWLAPIRMVSPLEPGRIAAARKRLRLPIAILQPGTLEPRKNVPAYCVPIVCCSNAIRIRPISSWPARVAGCLTRLAR